MSTLKEPIPVKHLQGVFEKLDQSNPQPLYRQIQAVLRAAILNRTLKPDDALPPERELAAALGVSRITVRKAIQGMVAEGELDTHHGTGTFVRSRFEKNFSQLTSFSEEISARGMKADCVWLDRSKGQVRPEESLSIKASPGTPVYRFARIRLADDSPMSLEYVIVLASCLPGVETVKHSLYAALDETGNRPVRALQRLSALNLNHEQAEMLGANTGDAGLLIERVGFNREGIAIEHSQSYYRGDTYDIVAELSVSE